MTPELFKIMYFGKCWENVERVLWGLLKPGGSGGSRSSGGMVVGLVGYMDLGIIKLKIDGLKKFIAQ